MIFTTTLTSGFVLAMARGMWTGYGHLPSARTMRVLSLINRRWASSAVRHMPLSGTSLSAAAAPLRLTRQSL